MLTAEYLRQETGSDFARYWTTTGENCSPRRDTVRHFDELGAFPGQPRAVVDRVLPYFPVYGWGELAGSSSEAARP